MLYHLRICFVSLFSLTLLFSCTSLKDTPDRFSALDKHLAASMPEDSPGGAVLIMKGDEVLFSKGYGVANVNTGEKITSKTLFNLGSISKTFVANAILILEAEGKLSVEDELIRYFPDFKNPQIARSVRIKHLLTHTSGLPDNRNVAADTVFYLTAKDEENWAPVLKADSLNFEPGSRFEYSNPAFNALALIVEKTSGMKWQKFIGEKIFEPSGMQTSTITDGPHPQQGVAHAYRKSAGKWIEDDYGEEPTFAASGNGGVWSSVEELAKYERAIGKGVFLSKEKITDSRTVKEFPNWRSATEEYIGWSWFITEKDGLKMVGHTGDQGGFLCNYQTIPAKQIFFVILCNTRHDVSGFSEKILEILKENSWFD